MIAIGDQIPTLAGTVGEDQTLALDQLRGHWLVLYFYPRDNTPGCTTEAKDFRDHQARFQAAGATIVGVSRDPLARHQRFAAKHELPFPLVADEDGSWCEAFGVIGEKKLYGKSFLGIVRSTFLIDPDGRVRALWRKVRVRGHVLEVLDALTREQTT